MDVNQVKKKNYADKNNQRLGQSKNTKSKDKLCYRCGLKYPHEKLCPAKDKKCNSCGKTGHFEKCCRSGNINGNGSKSHVKRVHENQDSDDEACTWRVTVKKVVDRVKNWFTPLFTLLICGLSVGFIVDTGSQVNIIDEKTFNKLRYKPKLYKCLTKLYGYGNRNCIETVGKFKTRVKHNGIYKSVEFIVTKGGSGNLLSYMSSVQLGIINEIRQVEVDSLDPSVIRYAER
ncbi:unnamed protein product [Brachionus calyciflorus]|uniref:CCHC-type domain-containing protein n=1 Tax=Brachionus calyciflorus TaxID=104777 RepID=A0A813R7C4_9BILA|nr:unnamed protein product [Brachionus calyciflorus]